MGNRYTYSQTFEEWCLKNNRQDILDLWDYDLNDVLPSEIPYGTKKRYYFKCPNGIHESETRRILDIVEKPDHKIICKKCGGHGLIHKIEDLTGRVFGELIVIEYDVETSKEKKCSYWFCKCSCGNIISASRSKLMSGKKLTCRGSIGHKRSKAEIQKTEDLRRTPEYYQFRKGVIKKDQGKCIISGETQNIEIHHIYSFALYPSFRFDINCGVCIGAKYHSTAFEGSFHNVYGRYNNTPEQFEEYVNMKRRELGIMEHFDVYEYMNDIYSDNLEIDDMMLDY